MVYFLKPLGGYSVKGKNDDDKKEIKPDLKEESESDSSVLNDEKKSDSEVSVKEDKSLKDKLLEHIWYIIAAFFVGAAVSWFIVDKWFHDKIYDINPKTKEEKLKKLNAALYSFIGGIMTSIIVVLWVLKK